MTPTQHAGPFTGLGTRAYNRASDSYCASETPAPIQRVAGVSKTEMLRRLVREHGSLPGLSLAVQTDLPSSSLVGALLKHDIALGRIKFEGGRYCWNDDFDRCRQEEAIADAAALLRRHGWRVKEPAR
ncbi:hypothetical protein [Aquabacterium sp.]|uniref:hypothetical protein n=1 Tax=Aquabacterium sp. TaxID=1872578 RepID=UPI0025BA23CE|nr:hypothetical protein [Aquabacterium sp.]